MLLSHLVGGSGKHYFPMILNGFSWESRSKKYTFITDYIYDTDIIKGKLSISNYDILLVPGSGVGDSEAISKGFTFSFKVKRWKKKLAQLLVEEDLIISYFHIT